MLFKRLNFVVHLVETMYADIEPGSHVLSSD